MWKRNGSYWHLALPTQLLGRLEQLPLDSLGSDQNVLLCQLIGCPAPSPSHFSFYEALPLNPSQQGQVEWMFAFGLVSDLRLEVISCQRLYISCFSQSIKTSTHTDKLFRCYVRLVWTNLKWMLELRKIMSLKEIIWHASGEACTISWP